MAIEIVGEDEKSKRKATCKQCGAILEFLPADIQTGEVSDYTGSSDTYYWIDCPRCKNAIQVREHNN